MTQTGCKIGKVKLKSSGTTIHTIKNDRPQHFMDTVRDFAKSIDDDAHAVGFFVLEKNGQMSTGCAYNHGFTASQLKGSCEHMKDCLMKQIWEK